MASEKQYGLIFPKKVKDPQQTAAKPSVFDNDSDSEGAADGGDWVKQTMQKNSQRSLQQRQAKQAMKKALEEDPSVYQYDEIYDQMQESRRDSYKKKDAQEKKPKYIDSILKAAAVRKREQEWRVERKMQKEREKEGDEFADKEAFVTSAYRKKMEEFQQLAEEEKRQAQIEAVMDVSKQKDLSGFYRHIYRQTMGEEVTITAQIKQEPVEEEPEKEKKEEEEKKEEVKKELPEETAEKETKGSEVEIAKTAARKMRQYRKREESSSSSGDEDLGEEEEKEDEEDRGDQQESAEGSRAKKRRHDSDTGDDDDDEEEVAVKSPKKENVADSDEKKEGVEEDKPEVKVEPKQNVWEKRTVGEALEAARDRFWARKAAREANRDFLNIY